MVNLGVGKGLVRLFLRNTGVGRAILGDNRSVQTRLRLGQIALTAVEKATERPTWLKYSQSTSKGRPQTDLYIGYVGEKDQSLKVHIAVDDDGRLLFVRDFGNNVIFDRSKGHKPPPGWK